MQPDDFIVQLKPEELFVKWFVVPLRILKEIPNNDGSFIALSAALFLYERYVVSVLKRMEMDANPSNKIRKLASDFHVTEETANIFWDVMRNGLLHQGMPKQSNHGEDKYPIWQFEHKDLMPPIQVHELSGQRLLSVQPWIFSDRVIALWQENISLLNQNDSFPWAQVYNFGIFINRDPSQPYLITGSPMDLDNLGDDQR